MNPTFHKFIRTFYLQFPHNSEISRSFSWVGYSIFDNITTKDLKPRVLKAMELGLGAPVVRLIPGFIISDKLEVANKALQETSKNFYRKGWPSKVKTGTVYKATVIGTNAIYRNLNLAIFTVKVGEGLPRRVKPLYLAWVDENTQIDRAGSDRFDIKAFIINPARVLSGMVDVSLDNTQTVTKLSQFPLPVQNLLKTFRRIPGFVRLDGDGKEESLPAVSLNNYSCTKLLVPYVPESPRKAPGLAGLFSVVSLPKRGFGDFFGASMVAITRLPKVERNMDPLFRSIRPRFTQPLFAKAYLLLKHIQDTWNGIIMPKGLFNKNESLLKRVFIAAVSAELPSLPHKVLFDFIALTRHMTKLNLYSSGNPGLPQKKNFFLTPAPIKRYDKLSIRDKTKLRDQVSRKLTRQTVGILNGSLAHELAVIRHMQLNDRVGTRQGNSSLEANSYIGSDPILGVSDIRKLRAWGGTEVVPLFVTQSMEDKSTSEATKLSEAVLTLSNRFFPVLEKFQTSHPLKFSRLLLMPSGEVENILEYITSSIIRPFGVFTVEYLTRTSDELARRNPEKAAKAWSILTVLPEEGEEESDYLIGNL